MRIIPILAVIFILATILLSSAPYPLAQAASSTTPSTAITSPAGGAPYSMNTFVRIRVLDDNSWSATSETPANVLAMIQDLKPQVLERMVSNVVNPSTLMPDGETEKQFLQAAESHGAIIIPRLSLDDANFYADAQSLYNFPINPPMRYLSLDNWAPYSQGAMRSQVMTMFQTLYAQGWQGIGVNMCGGYYPTYGYATFADFCVQSQQSFTPNLNALNQIRSAESNLKLFLLYIDFPTQMQQFATLSGDQQAAVWTNLAQQQAPNGYKLVYHVLQTFYDSKTIFTSSGQSMYSVMRGLIGGTTVSTTTTTTASSSSTTMVSTTTLTSSSTTTQSSSQSSSTSTGASNSVQVFELKVFGACPSIGGGSYLGGSTATVKFSGVCNRGGGSGLRVTSWSLDGGSNHTISSNGTTSISVPMYSSHSLALHAVVQYQLVLDYGAQTSLLSVTSPTIPSDYYWYDVGTLVAFTGKAEVRGFDVVAWALGGTNPVPISGGTEFTASFAMLGPRALQLFLTPACPSNSCESASNFDVTIKTSTSLPSGVWVDGAYYPRPVAFSWPAGSLHNITAAQGVRQSTVRTYFSRWTGESNSTSHTVMLTVNESGYLTAGYSKQYLVSLAFTDASGQPLTPQAVTLAGPLGVRELSGNLSAWVEPDAFYSVTSVTWLNWNVMMSNHSKFSVSQPASLTFPLRVYPQTIKVTDAYNLPLEGATVNVTTLNGIRILVLTGQEGIARFRVPEGLFSAIVSYLGVSSQIVAGSEGSHSYTVSFLLSYPLLATFLALLAIAGAFMFLRFRKKPKSGSQIFTS